MSIIIVGAGVAGLYCAYRLANKFDNIHILESSIRIGGRIYEERFYGFNTPMGASMIRHADNNTIRLCEELHLELKNVDATLLSKESDFINDMLVKIVNKYDPQLYAKDMTVMEFLREHFPEEQVQTYIEYSIYRDYLNSSIHEYIFNYPISDHLQEPTSGFVIKGGYYRLIDALWKSIKDKVTLHLNTPVTRVTNHFVISAAGTRMKYDRLYWTLTESNKQIIQPIIQNDRLLSSIFGVPFLTMYARVDSSSKYPGVVVGGLLGKMYPIGKNILMVAYTDGTYAEELQTHIAGLTAEKIIEYIQPLVRANPGFEDVTMQDIVYHYWPVGIHQYRSALRSIRHRYDNVYLMGEAVSVNQGWVEGAIESVDVL
jgi:hypothetical protein